MDATARVQSKMGRRLRALRTEQGLSIRALAARTGFSPSFISQVESDSTSVSIGSLQTIVAELGLTLGEFFMDLEAAPRLVVRRGDRARYESTWSRGTVEMLSDRGPGRKLSAVEVVIGPGGTSGTRAEQRHDSLIIVLNGVLTVRIEDDIFVLQTGDTAYLSEGVTISWENQGQIAATVVVITAALLPARADGVFDAAGTWAGARQPTMEG